MVSYSHLFQNFPQFVVIHTVKGFGVINKAEVDVFLEFSCFLYDPVDVGNLISASSAFSKSRRNIWNFSVDDLLKPAAAKSLQSCPTLCNPKDGSPPSSLSLGFSRQEHWRGLPFPSPMHESEK